MEVSSQHISIQSFLTIWHNLHDIQEKVFYSPSILDTKIPQSVENLP